MEYQKDVLLIHMTYGQYYLLTVVRGYIASLLAASLSMLVAAKKHTIRSEIMCSGRFHWEWGAIHCLQSWCFRWFTKCFDGMENKV